MAGSSVGREAGAARSGRKSTLLLVVAICVALASVLVAQAGAFTRNVYRFSGEGKGAGSVRLPGGIAVDPGGTRVFVADTENNRIDEFTAEGSFVRAWGWGVRNGKSELQVCDEDSGCRVGQAGQGEGQLNEPFGVAAGAGGTVYVVNQAEGDGRILKFNVGETVTAAGALPAGYGPEEGTGQVGFSYPLPETNDVAIGAEGQVYVADNVEGGIPRVVDFEPGGDHPAFDVGLSSITAIGVAPDGTVYVAGGNTVEAFGKDGEFIERFETRVYSGIIAIAFQPGTENLLVEPNGVDGQKEASELFELDAGGKTIRTIPVASMKSGYPGPNPFGLEVDPSVQFPESEPGAIYVVDRFGGGVNVLAEATPGEPTIGSSGAQEVGSDGATLSASVDPKGNDTHVYFEYGTSTAYGATSPASPGVDLGGAFGAKQVSVRLFGLQPNTTYHYAVVATSSAGPVTSADATFTTFPTGGPFSLPDGRAFELATPGKGANSVGGDFAAPGGSGLAFVSRNALPGSPSGNLETAYVGLRGPEGWRQEASSPPAEGALYPNVLISPDLSQSVGSSARKLVPGAPAGEKLYLRDNATGSETLMTPYLPAGNAFYEGYGASADFRHIFFRSEARLTPETPESGSQELYEWSDGSLKNVGILPGATTPSRSLVKPYLNPPGAVSEDGSRAFFVAEPEPGVPGQLFVRIGGASTTQLSASQAEVADPEAAQHEAAFVGAAADGSAAFFKTSARLTDDADTGEENGGPADRAANLYRYDLATGELTDLTVASDPADEELGAAVVNAVISDDGRSAYLVAKGDLAEGATSGRPNLYHWTLGRGIEFVAELGESDILATEAVTYEPPPADYARVSRDGSVFAFTSKTALDPAFPNAEGVDSNFETISEIYRYAAADGSLVCVSCSRAASAQLKTRIFAVPVHSGGYGGNVLSADGSRLFFTTPAALVPQDTNGKNDVYEWEGGSAHLISTGAGSGASLVDASASGDDVFINTNDQLVAADQDGYGDVYDARVGGGLPGPAGAAPPCEAAACLPPAGAAPATGQIGSRSLHGPGDKKAKHHRKKRHKHKHKKKHRRHAKHRKHTRSHGHPAVGKRG